MNGNRTAIAAIYFILLLTTEQWLAMYYYDGETEQETAKARRESIAEQVAGSYFWVVRQL